jgi:hypothetical protein
MIRPVNLFRNAVLEEARFVREAEETAWRAAVPKGRRETAQDGQSWVGLVEQEFSADRDVVRSPAKDLFLI